MPSLAAGVALFVALATVGFGVPFAAAASAQVLVGGVAAAALSLAVLTVPFASTFRRLRLGFGNDGLIRHGPATDVAVIVGQEVGAVTLRVTAKTLVLGAAAAIILWRHC